MSHRYSLTVILAVVWFPLGFGQSPPVSEREESPGPTSLAPAPLPAPAPVHHPVPACVERKIPQTQILLVPQERAITLPDWKLRDVEVSKIPGGPELKFHEEKHFVTELRLQPQEVEQQVVVQESRPFTVTDPCTGQCRTEYKLCPVVKTVKVTHYHTVPVSTPVTVRVPTLVPSKDLTVKKVHLDQTTTPALERRFVPAMQFNTVNVLVPACPLPTPPH